MEFFLALGAFATIASAQTIVFPLDARAVSGRGVLVISDMFVRRVVSGDRYGPPYAKSCWAASLRCAQTRHARAYPLRHLAHGHVCRPRRERLSPAVGGTWEVLSWVHTPFTRRVFFFLKPMYICLTCEMRHSAFQRPKAPLSYATHPGKPALATTFASAGKFRQNCLKVRLKVCSCVFQAVHHTATPLSSSSEELRKTASTTRRWCTRRLDLRR